MAENLKSRHAFGHSDSIEKAKQENKIDAYDILFLDSDTEPKLGWLDAKGNTIIVDPKAGLTELETQLEAELATKASSEDVETLEKQIEAKADASMVESLQTEIANKVDASEVETMIKECIEYAVEVVEF